MNDTNEPTQDAAPSAPSPVSIDLKRRMRELLSIPDSQRTDEQWDELIEIEIQLAPGNRVGAATPRQNDSRGQAPRGAGGGGSPGGGNWKRHGSGRKGKPGGGGQGGGNPGGNNAGGGGKKPPPSTPAS